MARYALITSTALVGGDQPTVIIEDGGTLQQYGRFAAEENAYYAANKMTNLDEALTGFSYYDIEVGDYSGTNKTRIDRIIATGKLPPDEQAAWEATRKILVGSEED